MSAKKTNKRRATPSKEDEETKHKDKHAKFNTHHSFLSDESDSDGDGDEKEYKISLADLYETATQSGKSSLETVATLRKIYDDIPAKMIKSKLAEALEALARDFKVQSEEQTAHNKVAAAVGAVGVSGATNISTNGLTIADAAAMELKLRDAEKEKKRREDASELYRKEMAKYHCKHDADEDEEEPDNWKPDVNRLRGTIPRFHESDTEEERVWKNAIHNAYVAYVVAFSTWCGEYRKGFPPRSKESEKKYADGRMKELMERRPKFLVEHQGVRIWLRDDVNFDYLPQRPYYDGDHMDVPKWIPYRESARQWDTKWNRNTDSSMTTVEYEKEILKAIKGNDFELELPLDNLYD